jgi:hypothetical protein
MGMLGAEEQVTLMLMAPLACIAVALVVRELPRRGGGIGGLRVLERDGVVRMRPSLMGVGGTMLLVLGVLPPLAVTGGVLAGGFRRAYVPWVWLGTGVLTMASGAKRYWRIVSGGEDLVLDGRLCILRIRGQEIAYGEIARLEVRRQERFDSDGKMYVRFGVWVMLTGRQVGVYLKTEIEDKDRETARQLAAYVAEIVGVDVLDEKDTLLTANGQVADEGTPNQGDASRVEAEDEA